jgi:leucyl aminopeptidase
MWTSAGLPDRLPPARTVRGHFSAVGATQLTLGGNTALPLHALSQTAGELPALVPPSGADLEYVRLASEALSEARDLINTPANDLGPRSSARRCSAWRCSMKPSAASRGRGLLRQNYPLIYEVGKGSAREPRLIDMRWGKRGAPLVTLVGKGVCFDTGGLDIKPRAA